MKFSLSHFLFTQLKKQIVVYLMDNKRLIAYCLFQILHWSTIKKQKYTLIGNYWERGNQNEIDIIAVDEIDKELLICEVKLSKKCLCRDKLIQKSVNLIRLYPHYTICYELLSPNDIGRYMSE
ncbi:MAG: YraN family protein [Cocleimonas sp.]|nr:YraN family protein [Cocleimonas sp.]